MHFEPTETQQLIARTARDYAERVIAPEAAALDREGRFPAEILKGLAELGLMGVNIPASLGGAEAGVVSYALAMMEIAGACASTAVTMAVSNMVAEVITVFGTEEQSGRYVPRITSGEYNSGAFALSEPGAGSDAASLTTQAERTDDGWVLHGEKQWITSGATAGVMVVWARTDSPKDRRGAKGISTFLVEKDTPGLRVGKHEDKTGLRASNTVPLTFEDCRLPAEALLGKENEGFKVAMMALDGGRIGISAQSCGVATAALREAVVYAKERKQFGKPIASFQAVGHLLADMALRVESARALLYAVARHIDSGAAEYAMESSMVKVLGSDVAMSVAVDAVQVFGGYGYMKEYPVEKMLRDAKILQIYEGTNQIQRNEIAQALIKRSSRAGQ
jgi:alkylation response protein AidB-like acyl-CoA dehydrogenase